jgi:hypothetical protein
VIDGARMVFGAPAVDDAAALGSRIYLPVAGDQFVNLVEVNFAMLRGPGLFGNKGSLLEEWRRKLGLSSAYNL